MFQIVSSSQDAFKNWIDFIRYKTEFYVSNPPQTRTDPGFPWEQIDKPVQVDAEAEVLAAELQKVQQRHIKNFEGSSEKLFEVRCLLEDDLSRHLFDETLLLRLVGHKNFIGPRVYFDNVLEKVSEAPFERPGFPNTYLGVPLVEMTVHFSTPERSVTTNLIVPKGFEASFNSYRQYFINRGGVDFVPGEGDVIFDCGACIGDISATFAGFAGKGGRVHAFDPIPLHVRFCELQSQRNQETSAPINAVNFAVGNETREIGSGSVEEVDAISPGGLKISKFNITRLDDYAEKHNLQKVNLIKMDIEGAEPDALTGAAKVLQDFKPKLAISTYHRPDQFWSVPLQIKQINPHYRFFFSHHSPVRWESVIYAY